MSVQIPRRTFLFALAAVPFAVFHRAFGIEKKTVKTTVAEAKAGLVKVTDTMPAALQYVEKAQSTKNPSFKVGSNCMNCMQYSQAVGSDGKEIKVDGKSVGSCAIFNVGKGFVTADGWCMSWFAAAK
jgi:hypothetical protein